MDATRRSGCGVSLLLATVLSLVNAHAARADTTSDVPPTAAPARPRPTEWPGWNFGVGLRFGGIAGGIGSSGAFFAPAGSVFLERRIVGPLSALARVEFVFDHMVAHTPEAPNPSDRSSTANIADINGALGLRIAFTTPKVLGVSMFALVEGGYSRGTGTSQFDSLARSVGGALGLTLDRELVPGFGVRVSSNICETRYIASRFREPGAPERVPVTTVVDAELELNPELQLRWSF